MRPDLRRHKHAVRSALLSIVLCFAATATLPAQPAFVPRPKRVEMTAAPAFLLAHTARILYQTRTASRAIETSLEPLAQVLAGEIELVTGIRPAVRAAGLDDASSRGNISLEFQAIAGPPAESEAEEDQSYTLDVTPLRVVVRSQYYKGVAFGTATLLQAIAVQGERSTVPSLRVMDSPAAAFRSVALDVARNVHSPGVIQDVIRTARLYKFRYVQLHLTDDENFTFPFELVTGALPDNFSYARQELRDLVAYADARGVTLIPELDLPGHSTKLKASGYLAVSATDDDVASPSNYAKITAIVDDILSVFASTPYFHIGGDESGAEATLVDFISAVNAHLRGHPVGGKRRLLVWEGFHDAPTSALPALGDDRVVVMSWESVYNPPWALLRSGYQLVNSSWAPTYVVGAGSVIQHCSSWRRWTPAELYRWDKNTFMHWYQGFPVYDDAGPSDPNRNDGIWNARWIHTDQQILGGQLNFWEQRESTVIAHLRSRAAVVAERLWNPAGSTSYGAFAARARAVDARVVSIVQPVEILPRESADAPGAGVIYQPYAGDSIRVSLRNRSRVRGTIRYVRGGFSGDLSRAEFAPVPTPMQAGIAYANALTMSGGFSVRAQLFRDDGTAVEGNTWAFFNNWPDRVRVTEYDIGRRTPTSVPDLAKMPRARVQARYALPMLRGHIRSVAISAQQLESTLTPPQSGAYDISIETQDGLATLYVDLNDNHRWDQGEAIIPLTPNTGVRQKAAVTLRADQPVLLRIDHVTAMPRPTLIVYLEGPGTQGRQEISKYLSVPRR